MWRPLLAIAVMMVAAPSNACENFAREVSLGATLLNTTLIEYSFAGNLLVREHGLLHGEEARASFICDHWIGGLDAFSNAGDRGYAGQTSLGTPLLTNSNISDGAITGSLYWQLTDSLQLGMDISQQHTTRTIIGTTLVTGYPESYDRTMTRIGGRWDLPSAVGRWKFISSFSVFGQQSMNLQLPGKDTNSLQFDAPTQWELGVQWQKNLGDHFYIAAAYRYINTSIGESQHGIVTSNGIPVGVVYQPKMKLVDRPLSVFIGLFF